MGRLNVFWCDEVLAKWHYFLQDSFRSLPPEKHIFDGLVHDCSNSSALAMELLQSCTKPSICWSYIHFCVDYLNDRFVLPHMIIGYMVPNYCVGLVFELIIDVSLHFYSLGPVYWQDQTGIRTFISNYFHNIPWNGISHPHLDFNGDLFKPPVKLGYGWVIAPHCCTWIYLLIHFIILTVV